MVQEMTTPSPEIVRANGKPQTFHGTSPADSSSRNSTELKSRAERHTGDTAEGKRESVDGEQPTLDEEDPPVDQIQHDLDELTFSGAAINDLEVQLMRHKDLYRKTLGEGRVKVDVLSRKLKNHIFKSQPFVDMWRKAKEVQEKSNRAAARYDKASSQHAAAKEMIRVAEFQLEARLKEIVVMEAPSSPSPLDAAWQEMLNHATSKVVRTEKERRDSELEHQCVLLECTKVMEEYRATEKRLRTHITKSRPYYETRYRTNQQLSKLKGTIRELEEKISETKVKYSASMKRLDLLSTEMHIRRGTMDSRYWHKQGLDHRQVLSTGNSPVLRHNGPGPGPVMAGEDTVSMDSLQWSEVGGGYGGSVSSLPSLSDNTSTGNEDQSCKSSLTSSSTSPDSQTEPHPQPEPHPPHTFADADTLLQTASTSAIPPTNTSLLLTPDVTTPTTPVVTTPTTPVVTTPTDTLLSSSQLTPTSVATPTPTSLLLLDVTTPSLSSNTSACLPHVMPQPSSSSDSSLSTPTLSTCAPLAISESSPVRQNGSCEYTEEVARSIVQSCLETAFSQVHPESPTSN